MNINGHSLTQFQKCDRLTAIDRTHTLNKWRPQTLISACLRHAIFNLSNGESAGTVSTTAVNNFLAEAKSPGLDVQGVDTYSLAMDYTAIIRNVLEYLSRLTLLCLREVQPISLSKNISWEFLSHIDESGTLHRWKFVDYFEDDITAELHSWEVFGDIAAADAPMVLHLVSIGRREGSHQNSPWCRIYAHPSLANVYKFKRVKGELQGDWKPVWFSGNTHNTPKQWVDIMVREGAVEGLVQHVSVKEVSDAHRKLFERDVLVEGSKMVSIVQDKINPRDIPLSRYSCDHPFACPHQFYCYNTSLTLDNAGIYKRRSKS